MNPIQDILVGFGLTHHLWVDLLMASGIIVVTLIIYLYARPDWFSIGEVTEDTVVTEEESKIEHNETNHTHTSTKTDNGNSINTEEKFKMNNKDETIIKCPKCGTPNKQEYRFCSNCTSELH